MNHNIAIAKHDQLQNISEQFCFILNITSQNGIWHGDNPFTESLPHFITQLAAILIVTRFLYYLLKPLHQPRIVSDILGGILLGRSAFGHTVYFSELFPTKNVITIETIGYMFLVFHVFIAGLEVDLSSIGRISKKAISFTVTGIFVPLATGLGFYYLLHAYVEKGQPNNQKVTIGGGFLWSSSVSVTSFPAVSQILTELNLINSDIGKLAMPIALISYLGSWILIVFIIPLCSNPLNAVYVLTTTIAYILLSFYAIRPLLTWMVRRTSEGNEEIYSEFYLCFLLVGVVLSACLTDVTGTHSVVGAFIFGLITPNELALVLMERFEYFVSGLMMPVFFAITGLRVDIFQIQDWTTVLFIVIMLSLVKIICFLPICFVTEIDPKDSFALGLLMGTKGIWAILIIHTGLEKKALHDDDYAVMVIAILLMTSMVAPIIAILYKRTNIITVYNSRTIQDAKTEAELRILACLHSFRNVPGMLKLLDVSHATQHNHTTFFSLYLVELTGRASTSSMLIVHDSHSRKFDDSVYHPDYGDSPETNEIVNAFREYGKKNRDVTIQSLTAVSPLGAMHGDICSIAEDKKVAFLIIPFHRRARMEENENDSQDREKIAVLQNMNKNVLLNAPCSVGIFVDRGLEEQDFGGSESSNSINQIAMVFLGGVDDCEALTFAWRMAEHPGVNLTVIRLLEMGSVYSKNGKTSIQSNTNSFLDRQKQMDDDNINEFRLRTVAEERIVYEEKNLQNGEELVLALKEIETKFDLFIVGRREGLGSPLTTELLNWVESPELGVIGDLLAISDTATASVLVVQQFVDSGCNQIIEDLVGTPMSSRDGSISRRLSSRPSSNMLGKYTGQKMTGDKEDDHDDDENI